MYHRDYRRNGSSIRTGDYRLHCKASSLFSLEDKVETLKLGSLSSYIHLEYMIYGSMNSKHGIRREFLGWFGKVINLRDLCLQWHWDITSYFHREIGVLL